MAATSNSLGLPDDVVRSCPDCKRRIEVGELARKTSGLLVCPDCLEGTV